MNKTKAFVLFALLPSQVVILGALFHRYRDPLVLMAALAFLTIMMINYGHGMFGLYRKWKQSRRVDDIREDLEMANIRTHRDEENVVRVEP